MANPVRGFRLKPDATDTDAAADATVGIGAQNACTVVM
jgi:hypothetical protein